MPELPTARLRPIFNATTERLYRSRGRSLTPFDNKIADAMFDVGTAALASTDNIHFPQWHVMSAPTGTGKSSFAMSFAVAACQSDPSVSVAFLVETMDAVETTYLELLSLAKDTGVTVACYSSIHKGETSIQRIEAEHGRVGSARFLKSALPEHRIIVTTHKAWLYGLQSGSQHVSHFKPTESASYAAIAAKSVARTLTFIDEHPSLVELFDVTPADVLALRDAVNHSHQDHEIVGILQRAFDRMERIYRGTDGRKPENRAKYQGVAIVSHEDVERIKEHYQPNGDFETSLVGGRLTREQIAQAFSFLITSADGYCFLSRYDERGARFVAYRMIVDPRPGYIVLDATADLSGTFTLRDDMTLVQSPQVNYSRLEIVHVEPPAEIIPPKKYIATIVNHVKTAVPYAQWIKQTVTDHTKEGDKVLVVTHKKMVDHGYLPEARNVSDAVDWEGRRINIVHWGLGIGSNEWKDCNVVFLFGEFHRPRRSVVGETLGIKNLRPSTTALKGTGGSELVGDFLTVEQGHLLRWLKQLSTRGNVRNIDGDGVCGAMKLVATAEFKLFSNKHEALFPGAHYEPPPKLRGDRRVSNSGRDPTRGIRGLVLLLRADFVGNEIDTAMIQERTGINWRKHGKKYFADPGIQGAMKAYGWSYVTTHGRGNRAKFVRVKQPAQQAAD